MTCDICARHACLRHLPELQLSKELSAAAIDALTASAYYSSRYRSRAIGIALTGDGHRARRAGQCTRALACCAATEACRSPSTSAPCPPGRSIHLHDMEQQPSRTASSFDLEAAAASFDTQRPRSRAILVTGGFFLLLSAVGIVINDPKVRKAVKSKIG